MGQESSWEFSLKSSGHDVFKKLYFLRDIPGRQKKQFYFLRKSLCLTVSYSLRGLPRKILGTCFLDFFGMFGIVCQMPAASRMHVNGGKSCPRTSTPKRGGTTGKTQRGDPKGRPKGDPKGGKHNGKMMQNEKCHFYKF